MVAKMIGWTTAVRMKKSLIRKSFIVNSHERADVMEVGHDRCPAARHQPTAAARAALPSVSPVVAMRWT